MQRREADIHACVVHTIDRINNDRALPQIHQLERLNVYSSRYANLAT